VIVVAFVASVFFVIVVAFVASVFFVIVVAKNPPSR
jgi:hypothetical protein